MSKLYIVPTPIGHLEDITLRGLQILKRVDLIACEDTRTSGVLLHHYQIKTPTISYHKHNERQRSKEIIKILKKGTSVALVSDAGMPAISDPGEIIIKECKKEGITVEVLPGPCAVVTAVVGSGITNGRYYFYGFLPHKDGEKKKELEKLKTFWDTLVFYESPHRLEKTFEIMYQVFGNRQIVLARELTKIHEEYIDTTLEDLVHEKVPYYKGGEYVFIVQGKTQEEPVVDIQLEIKKKMEEGMKKSHAVKSVAKEFGLAKNVVYEESLKW